MKPAIQGKEKRKRNWKKYAVGIFGVLILLLSVGAVYQGVALSSDTKNFPPTGQLVDINGHKMHVYGEGAGDITVVFASGHGTGSPFIDFYPLYHELAKKTRIVVYERFGYGWSETTTAPRDIDTITEEIHTLLLEAGEQPPFLLVGHSLASLETIRFAQTYPDEVVGLVMLDAGNPNFYQTMQLPPTILFQGLKGLKHTGIVRLLSHFEGITSFLTAPANGYGEAIPEHFKELDIAMTNKNFFNKSLIGEMKHANSNAALVVAEGSLGDLPLTIFTSGVNHSQNEEWAQSQKDFLNWSTQSKQIILENAGHYVHHFHPTDIVAEIQDMITTILLK